MEEKKIKGPLRYKVFGWSISLDNYHCCSEHDTLEKAIEDVYYYQRIGKCCYIDVCNSTGKKIGKVTIL